MTQTQITCPNRITFSVGKKGACSAEVGALDPVFEKISRTQTKKKLLEYKSTIQIATFKVRSLKRLGQLPELTTSAIENNVDIGCVHNTDTIRVKIKIPLSLKWIDVCFGICLEKLC